MVNKRIKIICIALLSLVLFVYLTIGINSIMNGNKIGFFSYRFYTMTSDSPEAGISTGDLVIAKSIKLDDIKKGDSVIYKGNDAMVVKKVVNAETIGGSTNICVEDNGDTANEQVENAQIMGKVVHTVTGIGNVALFVQSPMGTLNIIMISLCVFIIIKKLGKSENINKEELVS